MGILDNIFGAGNGGSSRQANTYHMILTESDFTTSDHQLLTSTTTFVDIASYTIPAQRKLRAGYGDPNHPENQGRVYAYLRTGEGTPAEITGKWRVIVTNRARTWEHTIAEFDEELTHGDLNDKRKLLPLPMSGPAIGEDDLLVIQCKPASAHETAGAGNDNLGWADTTESLLKIPVTVLDL